jgi:hypothetical protein
MGKRIKTLPRARAGAKRLGESDSEYVKRCVHNAKLAMAIREAAAASYGIDPLTDLCNICLKGNRDAVRAVDLATAVMRDCGFSWTEIAGALGRDDNRANHRRKRYKLLLVCPKRFAQVTTSLGRNAKRL